METSRPRSWRLAVALAAGLACPLFLAMAQFGPFLDLGSAPQAKTQQEFDAYLDVLAADDPRDRVAACTAFMGAHPRSALRGLVSVHEMEAHRQLDDFAGVLSSGERVLQLLPDNLRALLTLAAAIPNAPVEAPRWEMQLDQAEGFARRALEVMDRKEIPKSIGLEEWKAFRAGMASEAHEALGHVATKRGQTERAVREFEQAVRLNPNAEGRQWFRLGIAYALAGRAGEASEALLRAADLGPALVAERATQAIEGLGRERAPKPEQ